MSDVPFHGRVALVTGGSRGIGRATALQLAMLGADVAISYCSRSQAAEATVSEIQASGRRACHVQCDVSKPDQVDRMVDQTRNQLGPISLLVHSGAISNIATHEEMTYELFRETMDVNLNGTFLVTTAVKDEMIQQGYGRMVLLSSIAALRPRRLQIHYATAKAGVIALTRCFADALAEHNIRVNCVAPGLIDTEMAEVIPPDRIARVKTDTPMKRLGTPEEIADVITFLLSDQSSFMTGQTVVASGGLVTLP